MTSDDDGEREDHSPTVAVNTPLQRYQRCRNDDHSDGKDDADDQRKPETSQDLRNLEEEVRAFDFLLRRAPSNIVREQVGEKSLRQVNGEATEEEEA